MSVLEIVNAVIIALCVITYALMLYFKVKGNVVGAVSELIALAEATGLTGKEKMAQVVAALYEKVPRVLKRFLNEERLESIAQWIFDWMRKYADNYIEANTKAEESGDPAEVEQAVAQVNREALADLIAGLFNLTLPMLKAKAEEYGIDTEHLETKREVIRAIAAQAVVDDSCQE